MPLRISEQDYDNWWSSPVGVEVRNLMRENLDKLSRGTMTNAYARDHIGNAVEVGKYQATMFYYTLPYKELVGEE
jgi:hypothetical protein